MIDTELIRRRVYWATGRPDALGYVKVNDEALHADVTALLGYVKVNDEALHADVTALCDEVDKLAAVLARVREYTRDMWHVGGERDIRRLRVQVELGAILREAE